VNFFAKISVAMVVAAAPLSASAQDASWREGAYVGLSFGQIDSATDWHSGVPAQGRRPDVTSNEVAVSVSGGYDWDLGDGMGVGVELSFTPTSGTSAPVGCGNIGVVRSRECHADVTNTIQLGVRFLYDVGDTSALMVRGGYAMATIDTYRSVVSNARGPSTQEDLSGAYIGVGYMTQLNETLRFNANITHTAFGGTDTGGFAGREDIDTRQTALSLGLEMNF
jgi:opacity protein-like surface antigen